MSEPKEFWIFWDPSHGPIVDTRDIGRIGENDHAIEYSAYEDKCRELAIAVEALEGIEMNTRPECKANLETRMGVIAIDAQQALVKIKEAK